MSKEKVMLLGEKERIIDGFSSEARKEIEAILEDEYGFPSAEVGREHIVIEPDFDDPGWYVKTMEFKKKLLSGDLDKDKNFQ